MKYRTKDEEVDALENEIESLKAELGHLRIRYKDRNDCMALATNQRDALLAELADAKKLAMDLICANQGLKHKIDMMTKDADK